MSVKIPVNANLQKLVNNFGVEEGLVAVYNNLVSCMNDLQYDVNNTSRDNKEYKFIVDMLSTTQEQVRMLKSIISFYDPDMFSRAEDNAIENCMHL